MEPLTYRLKITLEHIRPPIWRRVLVSSDISLDRLHLVLQIAMGWTDSHLHLFERNGVHYGDLSWNDGSGSRVLPERRTQLNAVLSETKQRLRYTYDMGDEWTHAVVLEAVLPANAIEASPVCIAGKGVCPPEDCGGPYGYADLIAILKNPEDPEYEEMSEWLEEGFEPQRFDVDAVNRRLKQLRPKRSAGATRSKSGRVVPFSRPGP